ncbi:MAG: hypothetical protein V3V99_00760 [candidate division Zixibacteria bacterium]
MKSANMHMVIALIFILGTIIWAADDPQNPRVTISLGNVEVSSNDSVIVLPVYFSNPYDTVSGVELHVRIEENRHVVFAIDDIGEDGLVEAIDTSGTLISGWEWVGVNSGEENQYDFMLATMADWPDGTVTQPLYPQERGVLVKLVFRQDDLFPFTMDTHIKAVIETERTGISDYSGNSIGVVTTIEKQCERYVGDSCLSWKKVRVGKLDTTVVKFRHGSISIVDELLSTKLNPDFLALEGAYLGQTPPDSIPEIFAPGIVSKQGSYEYGLAISPDGDEIFFTTSKPGDGLMVTQQIDSVWTNPVMANLKGDGIWEFEAFYTVDGQKLYFSSHPGDWKSRIWVSEKISSGWSKAKILESPVNSADVFWATFTADRTMYFTNINESMIYRSKLDDGYYKEIEKVNISYGAHPFIAPDESFVLFNGEGDLFISYRLDDNTWTEPQKLNDNINTAFMETCPSLSPDGRYLFFSRYDEPEKKSNIYWVKADFIERFRPGQ